MPMNRADESRNLCSCFLCNFKELEEELILKNTAFMASRAMSYFRWVAGKGNRSFVTTTSADQFTTDPTHKSLDMKGEYAPIYMVAGLVTLAVSFAAHTAKQQLVNGPSVSVRKKRRSTVEEVNEPDLVAGQADRLISKSVFRKVAHAQDFDKVRSGITDPTRPYPFQQGRTVETLRSVGVNPSQK